MDYRDPETRDALAAEYVLGTLQGAARRRFERLLATDRSIRQSVEQWQDGLYPLIDALPDRRPPERVWQRVAQRIGPPPAVAPQTGGFWESLTFWRSWGLLATAAALVMAVYLGLQLTQRAPLDYLAVINDNAQRPTWLVWVDRDRGQLAVQTLRPPELSAGHSLELWLLPGEGQAPVSLGLLPTSGETALKLTSALGQILRGADGFAVSLEPVGGSPTGQPTGPVLYQGLMFPPA